MPKLTNWGTMLTGSDYTAPELRRLCLCGDLPNGKRVTTSAVEAKVDIALTELTAAVCTS